MAGEHLYERDFKEYDPVPVLNSVTTSLEDSKLRKLFNLPDSVTITNNWRWYDKYSKRWLESLSDCHRRALMLKEHFA